jgi:hypothetical protein
MTPEVYLAEMSGKIETLTLVCSILISLSPDKKQIAQLFTSIVRAAETGGSDAPDQRSYTNGIKAVISTLKESLETVSVASQFRNLKLDIEQ